MNGTRNTVLAVGSDNRLFVADAQNHDLRIIRSPYSGPADITRFPLPAQCRGPTVTRRSSVLRYAKTLTSRYSVSR
jgi:hypothetical protein